MIRICSDDDVVTFFSFSAGFSKDSEVTYKKEFSNNNIPFVNRYISHMPYCCNNDSGGGGGDSEEDK